MQVFLSYASLDKDFAKELASRLSESGLEVFDPQQDIFLP